VGAFGDDPRPDTLQKLRQWAALAVSAPECRHPEVVQIQAVIEQEPMPLAVIIHHPLLAASRITLALMEAREP